VSGRGVRRTWQKQKRMSNLFHEPVYKKKLKPNDMGMINSGFRMSGVNPRRNGRGVRHT